MTDFSKAPGSLNPSPEEIRSMGLDAINVVADYLGSISAQPVNPATTSRKLREGFSTDLPVDGTDFKSLLDFVRSVVIPNTRHNAHPRFFGYVAPPGSAATAIADLLASTLNPTVTSWRSAPAATEMELLTIEWIKQVLGFPESGLGLYVSGGSMANLCGLAVAREAGVGSVQSRAGLQSCEKPLTLYVSSDAHHSSAKAAAILGIGRDNVRVVAITEDRRMNVGDLVRLVEEDLANGCQPFCVVGSAGTTITGAIDPLDEIADVAFRYGIWLHVDACYGGFASLDPEIRTRFTGIERADSVALDPHKWLFVPGDCGCILYRDPEKARSMFGHAADYIRVIGQEDAESFAFWDYGPELSRRFRALKVWMMFEHVGTKALAQAIRTNCECAEYLGQLVQESEDFELLAQVGLSVFCFRFLPQDFRGGNAGSSERDTGEAQLNELNERILAELQRQGSSYLSNADLDGQFALRGCVLNYRTTRRDIEILLEDVRRAAATAMGADHG